MSFYVGNWHLADMPTLRLDVCFRGWTGHAVRMGRLPLMTLFRSCMHTTNVESS
jgi:hypothetical protein